MSFKAAATHDDRLVVKTEISIPWDSAVEDNSVMTGDIRPQNSVAGNEKKKNGQLGIGGRKN